MFCHVHGRVLEVDPDEDGVLRRDLCHLLGEAALALHSLPLLRDLPVLWLGGGMDQGDTVDLVLLPPAQDVRGGDCGCVVLGLGTDTAHREGLVLDPRLADLHEARREERGLRLGVVEEDGVDDLPVFDGDFDYLSGCNGRAEDGVVGDHPVDGGGGRDDVDGSDVGLAAFLGQPGLRLLSDAQAPGARPDESVDAAPLAAVVERPAGAREF